MANWRTGRQGGVAQAGPADGQIAVRAWTVKARIRMAADHFCGNTRGTFKQFRAGQELDVQQSGQAGKAADRRLWWTGPNVDDEFLLPAAKVEVLEVLETSGAEI